MDQLDNIQNLIYVIRGQRVMLDFDLARLYQVETKALNQAVKRNPKRESLKKRIIEIAMKVVVGPIALSGALLKVNAP